MPHTLYKSAALTFFCILLAKDNHDTPVWSKAVHDMFPDKKLFDLSSNSVKPSKTLKELLMLLQGLGEFKIDPKAFQSIGELNKLCQRELLRKPNKERWHMKDSSSVKNEKKKIVQLISELGFVKPVKLQIQNKTIDHCLVFGARANRVFYRLLETEKQIISNNLQCKKIYLLGSNRKTLSETTADKEEFNFILKLISELKDQELKKKWQTVFEDKSKRTEANFFYFIWQAVVSDKLHKEYNDKLIVINSTEIGAIHHDTEGNRPTTESTIKTIMKYYDGTKPQTFFATVEKPYTRIAHFTKVMILSDGFKLDEAGYKRRSEKDHFYFSFADSVTQKIAIYLDEVARNIYNMTKLLKYLDSNFKSKKTESLQRPPALTLHTTALSRKSLGHG